MTNILIVEDQRLEKQHMESVVKACADYTLAGAIGNAVAAEMFCQGHHVDLILMDICTENHENGLDAAAVIKRNFPKVKIIIVTSTIENDALKRARACGVESFWYKDSSPEELTEIISRTISGESVYPDCVPKIKFGNTTNYGISEAEWNVLRLLIDSADYAEIAEKLNISESTVRTHMAHVMDKTGYRSKQQLSIAIIDHKLIVPPPDGGTEE
jgi:DNA-binding NarL/FixJ family response regulator